MVTKTRFCEDKTHTPTQLGESYVVTDTQGDRGVTGRLGSYGEPQGDRGVMGRHRETGESWGDTGRLGSHGETGES